MVSLSDYDYELPKDRIAQTPMNPRENAKLMIVGKNFNNSSGTKKLLHNHIRDFPSYLHPDDVLVINNTRVFKARLQGKLYRSNRPPRPIELFLLRPNGDNWLALAKPGKHVSIGNTITIEHNLSCSVVAKNSDGTLLVSFGISPSLVLAKTDDYGQVPIPPYIKIIPDPNEYQTSYAKVAGSVAAPTAGFHITAPLLQTIKNMGVTVVEITLHVGLGTFQPIRTEAIADHHMHSEWVEISKRAADTINNAKAEGRRIIAVGTTTTRALEGVAQKTIQSSEFRIQNLESRILNLKPKTNNSPASPKLPRGEQTPAITPYSGDVNLFITPGFTFNVVSGLLTNFHLPKTTLLLLVSAFAASGVSGSVDKNGRQRILAAYQEAIRNDYRFYSFGDAMLII